MFPVGVLGMDFSEASKQQLEKCRLELERANSDSSKSIALVEYLGFLRGNRTRNGEPFTSTLDMELRVEALRLAQKSKCKSCEGYVHLQWAYGVPPEEPFPERFKHFDRAIDIFDEIGDDEARFLANVYRAEILFHRDQKDSSLASFLEITNTSHTIKSRAILAYFYHQRALLDSWPRLLYQDAKKAWSQSLLAVSDKDSLEMSGEFMKMIPGFSLYYPLFVGDVMGNLGLSQRRMGSLTQALASFKKANETYKSVGILNGQIWMLQMISQVHYDLGNFQEAISSTNASLSDNFYNDLESDPLRLISFFESLRFGFDYYKTANELEQFNEHVERAFLYGSGLHDKDSHVLAHKGFLNTWKAMSFSYLGDQDNAVKCARLAIKQLNELPRFFVGIFDNDKKAQVHQVICQLILSQADANKETAIDKALLRVNEVHKKLDVRYQLWLADILVHIDRGNDALAFCKGIEEKANKSQFIILKREISKKKARLLRRLGKVDEAYEELNNYLRYSDSIKDLSHLSALAEADARYRNEIAKRQNAELDLQNKNLVRKAANQKMLAVSLVITVILLGLTFFWYRRNRLKNMALVRAQLENERLKNETIRAEQLEQAERMKRVDAEKALSREEKRRLETAAMFEAEKAQRLKLELSQKEKELSGYAVQQIKIQQELNDLRTKIKRDLGGNGNSEIVEKHFKSFSHNDTWEEFSMRMEKVHPAFNKTVNDRHPDLTPNERKLCALIRMNLATKQIATLLNNSPDSVIKARYRLRKKMGLEKSQDLLTYLESMS